MNIIFFGGGQGLNPEPYIHYALSLPTELSLRRHITSILNHA